MRSMRMYALAIAKDTITDLLALLVFEVRSTHMNENFSTKFLIISSEGKPTARSKFGVRVGRLTGRSQNVNRSFSELVMNGSRIVFGLKEREQEKERERKCKHISNTQKKKSQQTATHINTHHFPFPHFYALLHW